MGRRDLLARRRNGEERDDERERLGTVLHVVAQCVADLNRILAPFLPHSSNAVHAAFGGEGTFMPMPVLEEVSGRAWSLAER